MLNATVIPPFAHLLAWLLDDEVEEWDTIDEIKSNLIPALLRRPLELLGILLDDFTGGEPDDVVAEGITFGASLLAKLFAPAQSLMDAIFSGYTGTVSSGATVSDLSSTMSSVDSRITALEGGGVQLLYGTSSTVDLTVHPITGDPWYPSEVKVWMWQGGYTPGTGGTGGQFAARAFTTSHLESLGVSLDAFEVVVGAPGGAHSKVGEYGSGSYALETTGTSYYLNSDGIYQEIPAGVAGGNGGSPGQRRIGTDATFNGVPVVQSATSGSAGGSTQIAAGGVGGTATQGAGSGSNGQGVGGTGGNLSLIHI